MIAKVRVSMLNGCEIIGRSLSENVKLFDAKKVDRLTVRNFAVKFRGDDITPKENRGNNTVELDRYRIRSIQTF